MKRDLDLFRSILTTVENSPELFVNQIVIEGYDDETIGNHLVLLNDAKLIEGKLHYGNGGKLYGFNVRLTNEGYEYIALAKNNTLWTKLKAKLKDKAIDFSFDISKYMLTDFAKELLK